MNMKQRAGLSVLALVMMGALAACGGDGDDNDSTGDSGNSSSGANVSSSSSQSSVSSSAASTSSASSAAGTKTCPSNYHSITISGSFVPNATLYTSSDDGKAELSVKLPATQIGSFKICVGTPDASVLPTNAGARNYEVIGEGAYASLLNPTLTITYANAGNVTIDYLPIPASGAYSGTPNRTTATTHVDGSANVAAVSPAAPGLYMTSEATQ